MIIIDNFYNDPDDVRNSALDQHYFKPKGNYPGMISRPLLEVDAGLEEKFLNTLWSKLFESIGIPIDDNILIDHTTDSIFQTISNEYKDGFVYNTAGLDRSFVGVVFLNPDAPVTAGINLYVPCCDNIDTTDVIHDHLTSNINNDEYNEKLTRHNSQFKKIDSIGNIYNRMVLLPSSQWQSHICGFGDILSNTRLVQLFFTTYNIVNTNVN